MRVTITGCRHGMSKVRLTRYLKANTEWSWAQAKNAADDVRFGMEVIAEFPDTSDGVDVEFDLMEICVTCIISKSEP